MAFNLTATGRITVPCPHCGKLTVIVYPDVAISVIGVCCSTGADQGKNQCICDHCGKDYTVVLRVCADVVKPGEEED